ncbi:DUF1214 domain-containing protein [Tepidicaulis sp.]|uniref:DUF1214 domain-containing protein n=1 Tax=Tepidicaulis sp. TaxID=1920809 RepID=UPI003B590495
MKKFIFWASAAIAALVLGAGSTALILKSNTLTGGVRSGSWGTNLAIGSEEAGLYTRAIVAVYGLLALSKEETIYYTAGTDDSGAPLSGDCTYRLEGKDLDARWWSITAYGPDSFLMDTGADHYSVSQTSIAKESDGSFTVRVSAKPQEGNWLPVKAGQSFDVMARFYNPGPAIYESPETAPLPAIVKETCE